MEKGKYTREEAITRLAKNGIKPVYHKKTRKLLFFQKPRHGVVGLKLWSYLDFLKKSVR